MLEMACLVYEDFSFYDLRELSSTTDYTITDSATSIVYSFNLCGYAVSSCDTENPTFAYMTDSASACTDLSTSDSSSISSAVVDEVNDVTDDYYLINA
jgi:hypothetical protein